MAKNVVKYSENIGNTAKQQATNIFKDHIKNGDYSMLLPIVGLPIRAQDGFSALVNGGTVADDALYNSAQQFYKDYYDAGLTADDLDNYLTTLYRADKIDTKTYKNAINSLDRYQETHDEDSSILSQTWWDAWTSRMNKKELAQLYEAMTEGLNVYDNVNTMTIDELAKGVRDGVLANAPTISGPPAPNYNVVRTGTPDSFPVGTVPLWTGQELADLNKTNYDPNHYYDIIKQGTEANVLRDRFGVDQRDIASRTQDSRLNASYLDNIRNIKAESIAAGATRGARAANEMLATNKAISGYADTQNKVRQTNYGAMLDSLLDDASAKITAQEYFNNLANTRYNEGVQFYANDTDSQGQELLTDAELYSADVQDRAQAAYANALMDAAYNKASAQASVAQGAVNGPANEYAWWLKTFDKANGNNIRKSVSDMDAYIFNRYTGQPNVKSFLNTTNK